MKTITKPYHIIRHGRRHSVKDFCYRSRLDIIRQCGFGITIYSRSRQISLDEEGFFAYSRWMKYD